MDDATAQPWRHRHAVCTAATSDMVVPCHYGISVGRSVGIWQLEASSPGCGSRAAGGGESRRGGAGHDGAGRAKTGRSCRAGQDGAANWVPRRSRAPSPEAAANLPQGGFFGCLRGGVGWACLARGCLRVSCHQWHEQRATSSMGIIPRWAAAIPAPSSVPCAAGSVPGAAAAGPTQHSAPVGSPDPADAGRHCKRAMSLSH